MESWHTLWPVSPSPGVPWPLLSLTVTHTFFPRSSHSLFQPFSSFPVFLFLTPSSEFIQDVCSFFGIPSSSESLSVLWAGYHLFSLWFLAARILSGPSQPTVIAQPLVTWLTSTTPMKLHLKVSETSLNHRNSLSFWVPFSLLSFRSTEKSQFSLVLGLEPPLLDCRSSGPFVPNISPVGISLGNVFTSHNLKHHSAPHAQKN